MLSLHLYVSVSGDGAMINQVWPGPLNAQGDLVTLSIKFPKNVVSGKLPEHSFISTVTIYYIQFCEKYYPIMNKR